MKLQECQFFRVKNSNSILTREVRNGTESCSESSFLKKLWRTAWFPLFQVSNKISKNTSFTISIRFYRAINKWATSNIDEKFLMSNLNIRPVGHSVWHGFFLFQLKSTVANKINILLNFSISWMLLGKITEVLILYLNNFGHKSFKSFEYCLTSLKLFYYFYSRYSLELDPGHLTASDMKVFLTKTIAANASS